VVFDTAVAVSLDGSLTGTGDAEGDTFGSVEILIGSQGADHLRGASENEQIYGRIGNDTLDGGSGADAIYGGDGDDRVEMIMPKAGDLAEGGAGTDALMIWANSQALGVSIGAPGEAS
jgi:hypothetical protein